VSFIFAVNF